MKRSFPPESYSGAIVQGNILQLLVYQFRHLLYTLKAFNPNMYSIFKTKTFIASVHLELFIFLVLLCNCFFSSTSTHSSEHLLSPWSNIPTLFCTHKPLCPSSPPCVEIRLQQWTLRVMVMECIWGANSFLSPTCMQNHTNGESLAPVYNTERGASTMATPLLSLKPLADRSAQSPPVKTLYCWIKKKAEEKKKIG